MIDREDIVNSFQKKYEELKRLCPDVGPFVESAIYQNPDGGWQMTIIGKGTITLSGQFFNQGIIVPFFTYGAIFRRWIEEGGAWNENHVKGRFGYPTGDVEVSTNTENGQTACQSFERGHIRSFSSGETEICVMSEEPSLLWRCLRHVPPFSLFEALEKAEEPWRGPVLYSGECRERKRV